MRLYLALAVMILAMVSSPARCELDPDPQSAEAHAASGNADVVVRLDSERRIVSGTNSRLALYADVLLLPGGPPEDFDDWSVLSATCTIGVDQVQLTSVAPAKPYVRQVRFASNHFTNGALPVQFHVVIGLHQNDGPLPYTQIVDMGTLSVSLEAYNRAYLWGTTVTAKGEPLPALGNYTVVSTLDSARSVFGQINFEVTPSKGMEQNQQRPSILAAHSPSTAIFAMTHGLLDGVCDSNGFQRPDGTVSPDDFVMFTEAYDRIILKGVVPLHDFVAYYCCNTTAGWAPLYYFAVTPVVDKAYVGFSDPISFAVVKGLKAWVSTDDLEKYEVVPITEHVNILLLKLVSGAYAKDAVDSANRNWSPITPHKVNDVEGCLPKPLELLGDYYCRLKNVYLPQLEWDAMTPEERNTWYVVK